MIRRHPWWTGIGAAAMAGLVAFVLLYFAPQDLFIQTRINEPLPMPTMTVADVGHDTRRTPEATPGAVIVLAHGRFSSGEHATSGTAKLIAIADGRRFVRLESLSTSNGPAVRIWLSAASAGASDGTVNGAPHLDLGGLKANHGNQNYPVPAHAALDRYRSVAIWCDRFDVVFGSAPLVKQYP